MRKFLFSTCLCLCLYSTIKADHFSLSGTVTGSFNGAALSSSASLPGLSFSGGAFTFQNPLDTYGLCCLRSNNIGLLTLTNLDSLVGGETFTVRLLFDPINNASPGEITFHFRTFINWDTRVLGLHRDLDAEGDNNRIFRSITFTTDETLIHGDMGIGFDNMWADRPSRNGSGAIGFFSVSPPHPTPEPTSIALLLTGIGAAILRIRSYRK